jgi:hypothetical protein
MLLHNYTCVNLGQCLCVSLLVMCQITSLPVSLVAGLET